MPHLIIELSSNIPKSSVANLQKNIQSIMNCHEGNYDADQCKCRTYFFDEYLVGNQDQSAASFIHITLKALSGRSAEIKKSLSAKISVFVHKFYNDLNLPAKRCDISVDMVEMDREAYQKIRIED